MTIKWRRRYDTYARSQEDPEANLRVSSWKVLFFHWNDLHVKDRDIRKLVLHRYLCVMRGLEFCVPTLREREHTDDTLVLQNLFLRKHELGTHNKHFRHCRTNTIQCLKLLIHSTQRHDLVLIRENIVVDLISQSCEFPSTSTYVKHVLQSATSCRRTTYIC